MPQTVCKQFLDKSKLQTKLFSNKTFKQTLFVTYEFAPIGVLLNQVINICQNSHDPLNKFQ